MNVQKDISTVDSTTLKGLRYAGVGRIGTLANRITTKSGFEEEERSFGDIIALIHSELSEALEEYRNGKEVACVYFEDDTRGEPKPEGVPVELADTIIRILQYCDVKGIDIGYAIEAKMQYNLGREYRHGGKKL